MAGCDELYELRNYFYLGNLTAAWTEGETVSVDDAVAQTEKDVILARIRLAQGKYDDVISSVTAESCSAMQVVKYIAMYMKDSSSIEGDKDAIHAMLSDESKVSEPCFSTMAGTLYFYLGDIDNALRALSRVETLDSISLGIHILLSIDRADVAEKEVDKMVKIDEDATLTQLSNAWVKVFSGVDIDDAEYIFRDLLERHGATDTILNGLALCSLGKGKIVDAEKSLQEALSKNPNYPSTLINAVITARYRNKPAELISRYLEQLQKVNGKSKWLQEYNEKEAEFDALAAQLEAA